MTSLTYHCWERKLITLLGRTICQYVSKAPKLYIWFKSVFLLLHIMDKDVLTRMLNKASYMRILRREELNIREFIQSIHLINLFIGILHCF